jgi:hypothetical protein
MALIAHYKLDGDATDCVGSNHGSASNVSWVNGKLGQAGSFTNSTVSIGTGNTFLPLPNLSLSAWIKTPGLGDGMSLNGILSITYGLTFYLTESGILSLRMDDGSSLPAVTGGGSLNDNEFHHVCATYDGTHRRLYIDGVRVHESLFSGWKSTTRWMTNGAVIGQENNNGPVYRFNGLIDDVRIYDHALSKKEVQELAKAKVLHYTFNDFQEPAENLVASASLSSYAPYHNISGNADLVSMAWATTNAYITINGFGTLQGKTLTVSGTMKKNGIPYLPSFTKVSTYQANNATIHVRNTNTGRFEITQYYDSTNSWLFHTGFTANSGDVITIEDFQVEEKDHATPFVNGTRTGVIQDSSGQGNDATLALTTTPKWTSDSKLGAGAYDFEPAKYINTGLPIRSYNCSSTDSKNTISCWVKLKANPSGDATLVGGAYYSGFALAVNTSGQIRGYYRNSTSSYNTSSYTLTKNVWFHVAVVQDLSVNKLRLYVNGVKTAETSVTNSNFGQETMFFQINRYQQTGGNTFGTCNVDLDDVIWYASALTDDQVLELYQTRASLDDQGNLLC